MAGRLILVPPSRTLMPDAEPIGPGYPRDYTPEDMRRWADDLAHLYRVAEADGRMPADDRRVVETRDKLMTEAHRGIKGSLRDDGTIDLTGGRHRAHYIIERGTDPVPVWVTARDPAALERFSEDCRTSLQRSRPDLARSSLQPEDTRSRERSVSRVEAER